MPHLKRSLALILVSISLLAACQVPLHRESRLAMSTTLTVLVSGSPRPDWDELFELADRQAWLFDHRRAEGPIGLLNRQGRAVLPPEVITVLRTGQEIAASSDGAFDPTILPLTALWSFDSGGRLPAPDQILAARHKVDYSRLRIDQSGQASLPAGFGLDLGGIAKGAVVDALAGHLLAGGRQSFLIDAGGDILVSGLKEGRHPWRIAIRHPRSAAAVIGVLSLGAKGRSIAVVTSGDYERYFEQEGRRFHHLLDPRSGYPAQGLASVTVIAPDCTEADALATAVFVLGPERGLELLEELPDCEGLLIEEQDGRLQAARSSGFPLPLDSLKL